MSKERMCNSEFIADMMEFGRNAPIVQMIVMEAIRRYAKQVAECKPEDLKGMKGGIVSPEAWIAVGKEVHAKMEERLG